VAIKVYFGIDTFGRIDEAGGGWWATRFFHIYYLPLIPVGGVQGVIGPGEQELALRAPLRAASVGLAYFKWIGFLAAAGLLVLAYNDIEQPPGATGFLLGAAGMALFAAVVSAWVWIGDRKATPRARVLSLLVPILIAGGGLGWAFQSRLQRQSQPSYRYGLRMHAYQEAHPGTSELDYAYVRLGAVVAAEKGPAPPAKSCGSFVTDWEGRNLTVVERGYLERLVASGGRDRDSSREWLASRPIRDLDERYPYTSAYEVSARPWLAVLSLRPPETEVRIYDLIEGAYRCGTRFAVPLSPAEGYLRALEKAVGELAPELQLETYEGHAD
jgi:hypothetical protein